MPLGQVSFEFTGMGAMGSRIARRLRDHAYQVAVYDRALPIDQICSGADRQWLKSIRNVECGVICESEFRLTATTFQHTRRRCDRRSSFATARKRPVELVYCLVGMELLNG
jgi:hypothetical protein